MKLQVPLISYSLLKQQFICKFFKILGQKVKIGALRTVGVNSLQEILVLYDRTLG